MRRIYSAIAWIIAGGVVVQAASIAFGFGGMVHYIQGGGVVDKALVESHQATFTGDLGFPIHGIVGGTVIPVAALALLIVAFFVKVHGARLRGARLWAAVVLALVALQITLGYSIADMPYLGLIHGANALAVLLTAVYAALRSRRSSTTGAEEPATDAVAT
jgi:heme A synthase